MRFTFVYNKQDGSQHTAVLDDESLAIAMLEWLEWAGYEVLFYPQWDSNGVFIGHKE